MKLTKRAISLLLTLLMVVGCLSGLSLTASAANYNYNVWVLGTQVTDANKNDVLSDGGSVRYNPSLGILYLTSAGTLNGQTQNHGGAVIYASGDLTLELSGTATLTAANYGIVASNLSIHGDGKLIVYGNNTAISVNGTLYLDDEDSAPTVTAQGAAYGIKASSAVLLHGNLTAQTTGGGTSGTVPNAGLYVTGGKLELGSSDPRVFRNNLNLTLIGHDSLPAPGGSPALYAEGGIEISSCLNVTAPEEYQLSSDHCRLLTSSGENVTNFKVQPKQNYRIQLTGEGGTVTTNQPGDLAFPGQRVTLSLVPDEGCSLVDLVCLDGEGDPLALTNTGSAYSFLMPENSVEVYALFSDDPNLATYAVDMDASMENGVVIPDYYRQTEGEPVTLTVVPDAGYQLTDISVSADGNDVPLTQDGSDYTFTMPAADVTVHATFEMVGGLYVCGMEVTPDNANDILGDGTASYNFETHTLTVNNLPENGNLHEGAVIWTLMPELTVTGSGYIYKNGSLYGIFAENADLTLSGDLTVLGGTDGVKAKSLRVSDVSTMISINGAHISGKVTVRNSVTRLFFSGNLYCEELVLGDLEYIDNPAGGTASSVINTNVGMINILHHERHTITVTDSFYGTVTADKTEAFPGETVQLTSMAESGCSLGVVNVTDANGDPVSVSHLQFTMPDSDVTVSASYYMNAPSTSESYDLWVAGVAVTSSNCRNVSTAGAYNGKISYNPATHTLYFDNCYVTDMSMLPGNYTSAYMHEGAFIYTDSLSDLTIVGKGDNYIGLGSGCDVNAAQTDVTFRGGFFQFAHTPVNAIIAKTVTFDGGSSDLYTYGRTHLVEASTITVTNRNEVLKLYSSENAGMNYNGGITGATFVLDTLQVSSGSVESKSMEIRRRPENTVTVEEAEGGRVTTPSRTAIETNAVDLTIKPEDGYALQSLTVTDANGNPVSVTVNGSSATFRMPASAVTVTPVFELGYAVRVASATHGSVTAEKLSYGIGETVTLTVSPAGGYELNELTIFAANGKSVTLTQDPTNSSCYTFKMPGCDVTVAARFARRHYTVNVSKTGNGSYTISDTVASFGDTVTLTTTPEPGYSVQSVTVNNSDTEVTQDGNSYSFIMPAANVTVTVRFVHTLHTVTVEATEHGTVTADKAGAYYGDTVTLTVTPDRSYLCTGLALLYDGSAHPLTLSGNSCSFTMPDADVSVAASFTSPDFRINVSAEHGTVSVSPNPAKYTDTVTLTATPDTGYRLTDLCVDGASLFEDPNVTPTLTYLRGSEEGDSYATCVLLDGKVKPFYWFSKLSDSPYIIFKADSAFHLTDYTLTTAATTTSEDRNWQDWTIYGANFASDEEAVLDSAAWQTVVSVTGDTTMQAVNCTPYTFTLDEPASSYQYYKIVITASRTGTMQKMAELSMRGLKDGVLYEPHEENSSDWTFTMPAKDVDVTAEFSPIDYEITVDEQAHAVTTVPETAHYGDKVQPTATVDEGWRLLGFTVTDEDGTVLPTYADNSFVMPAKNVTVAPRLGAASYTLAVMPTEHGTVTASQTIANCGDEITFTVTPDEGYVLDKLTVLNFSYETVYQSTVANEYKFSMPAKNLMVVAKFVAAPYSVTVQNAEHGTVTASTPMAGAGMTVTLNLIPDTGYELDTLTVTDANGKPVTVENNQFTMPASDVTVTASFALIPTYEISCEAAANGTVSANVSTAYVGDEISLTVTPDEGYELDTLTVTDANGNPISVENDQFTMPASDVTVTATFARANYSVTVVQPSYGNVTADKATAQYGETVTLSATPNATYELTSYNVTDAEGNPVPVAENQFTMPASDANVTATFTPIDYDVTVASTTNGTVTADKATANAGQTITLTVTPDEGYELDTLTVTDANGDPVTVENNQFTMPASDVTVTASFALIPTYEISCEAAANGTVSANASTAHVGDEITLTVTPDEGYALDTLTVTDANGDPVTVENNQFTMPASNVTVTAIFTPIDYTVTVVPPVGGTVSADPVTAHVGDIVTLTATAYGENSFESWSVTYGDNQTLTVENGQFTMPAANVTVTATFNNVIYDITVAAAEHGTVTADRSAATAGEIIKLTAAADEGYSLNAFTVTDANGNPVPVDGGQFTMPAAAVTVTATFGTSVPYVDAQGNAMTPVDTWSAVKSDTTELTEGWWVVTGSVSNGNRLTVSGSVNLILCDSATLNATSGIAVGGGNSLTVWAQSHGDGRGKLIARAATTNYAGIGSNSGSVGAIEINGGDITATGGYRGAGIGGGLHSTGGSITINNGKVSATGGTNAAGIGGGGAYWGGHYGNLDTITITGGQVTATGSGYGAGIGGGGTTTNAAGAGNVNTITITGGQVTASSPNGYGIGPGTSSYQAQYNGAVNDRITFGWTATTDFIQSSKNVGANKLAFVDGKPFLIDELYIAATTSNIQSACKLIPLTDLSLLRYSVTIASGITNGTVTTDKASARFGDTVTLTTTPEPGYSVQSVTVNNSNTEVTQDGNSYSFIMPAANVTVTVRFVHTLHTVTVEATEHGTVTADKAGAYYGDTVTLTVTPDRSYLCTGLALLYDGSAHPVTLSGNTCSFTMPDADVSIAASFTSPDFRINVSAEHGTVTASPNPAKYGDTVTLTATPDTGYRLTDLCVEEDSLVSIPDVTPSLTALHGNRIGGGEEYYRLVDGNTQTRWYPNEAPSATNPYIVIKTNQPVCLTEYTLTEAHDLSNDPGSRWKSWTIYGANFDSDSDATQNSDAWQVVSVIVDDTLLQPVNFATATYTLDAPAAQYQYYKIVVNASQGSSRVRMGEFSMRGLLMVPHDEASNDWTFTMPAKDVTVTAEFTAIDYNVTVTPATNGTVTADKEAAHVGDEITLTVTPDEGYELDTLTVTDANGDPIPVENNQFTMPAKDVTVTATFTATNYTVTVTPTTNGTVTTDKAIAQMGDTVILTVTPDTGYELDTLTVTDANGDPIPVENNQFIMPDSDVTVTATFALIDYNVTVTPATNGTVTADKAAARAGETVTLTVTPDAGYELDSLTVESTVTPALTYLRGSAEGTDNGKTRMLLDGDVNTKWYSSMSARPYIIFKADHAFCLTDYTLTTGADTAEYGRRNWQDWTIYGANFASDEEAVPDSAAWQTVVSVTGDTTMQAVNCTPYTFTLDEAASSYQYYKIVITASRTNNDMQMAELSMRGLLMVPHDEASNDWTFTMPAKDVTVTASFTAIDYNVTVTPTTNGTVTADKATAQYGETVTLTVTPDEGYELDTLTVTDANGNPVTVENNQFTMPASDVTVTASFALIPTYEISCEAAANGTVSANASTAHVGDEITLTVTPDEGYELDTLTVTDANGNPVTVENNQFTMPAANVTVTATFKASAPVTYTYFVGNSLSLQGDIGVNFYVKLNDVAPANARVEFTWGSGSRAGIQTTALSGLTADANGRYKLTVRVAAAQMTDTITAELYDGETPVATQQYSVAKYARYVLGATDAQLLPLVENNADKAQKLRNLCKAMLIYGGKSQQQFKYNTYAPADQNLEYTLSDIPDGVLGTTTFPEGFEDTCGIQFYAASLILESRTTYRLYFTVTDQAKLDALGMEYDTSGSYVYFDIANISATEVFKDHSMSFGGLTVTANAGTYATAVLSGENETLKDVVKALYWYSDAAKTFFGVQ